MKLLTFNTGLLEVSVGPVRFDPVPKLSLRAEVLPASILALDADVVCLQEVYRVQDSYALQKLTDIYPYSYKSPHANILKNTGLFIMSKYPFTLLAELDFRASGVEKFVAKGAVAIELTGGPDAGTVVVNSHFPYGGFGSNSQTRWYTIKKRNSNLEYLHTQAIFEGKKVIVAGDFNFGQDIAEENYEKMLSFGYTNISNGSITWDVNNPLNILFPNSISQSIDHIFLNTHLMAAVDTQSCRRIFDVPIETRKGHMFLSDHFGLLCDFELKYV